MEIILVIGFPGKKEILDDSIGDEFVSLKKLSDFVFDTSQNKIIGIESLDSGSEKARLKFIELCKKQNIILSYYIIKETLEIAVYNYIAMYYKKYNKIPTEQYSDCEKNIYAYADFVDYAKSYKSPTEDEFLAIGEKYRLKRQYCDIDNEFITEQEFYADQKKGLSFDYVLQKDIFINGSQKALFLDYDGTIRETISNEQYPKNEDDIKILPNRKNIIQKYMQKGYLLFGISNQSGIALNIISESDVQKYFAKTHELLGLYFQDMRYCPHGKNPTKCFCRKGNPGFGIEMIIKYNLNPAKCIMVGDRKEDEEFANNCGFKFINEKQFFTSNLFAFT